MCFFYMKECGGLVRYVKKLFWNREGSAHFEMVISFMFFFSFIFFLFLVIEPVDSSTIPHVVGSGLQDSFEERTEVVLAEVFLQKDFLGNPQGCNNLSLPTELFSGELTNSHVLRRDNNLVWSSSVSSSGVLQLLRLNGFYEVSLSSEFVDEDLVGCPDLDTNPSANYTIGSIYERDVISYKKLTNLTNEYVNNYSIVRADLNVPTSMDFSITSEDLPIIDMVRPIPDGVEVFSTTDVYQVIREDGTLTNVRFNFRVW